MKIENCKVGDPQTEKGQQTNTQNPENLNLSNIRIRRDL